MHRPNISWLFDLSIFGNDSHDPNSLSSSFVLLKKGLDSFCSTLPIAYSYLRCVEVASPRGPP